MAGAEEPLPKKRKGFVFKPIPKPERRVVTPLVSELTYGPAPPLPAPPEVKGMFRSEELVVGIDVETHALVPAQKSQAWRAGRFGLQTKVDADTLAPLRLVQIGWAIGEISGGQPEPRSRIIKPDGFEIETSASAKHRIDHNLALAEGVPLRDALKEMLQEVLGAARRGGRVCAHHLEFDATVIANEMERAGLGSELAEWERVVRAGLCTMDPHIGHWVRTQAGSNDVPHFIPIRLADAVASMVPDGERLLVHHHDAGGDARMHWLLFRELDRRAKL